MSERKRMLTMDEIEEAIRELPVEQRERLLELLAASLPVDPDVEREWTGEAHRRLEELETGAVEGISADQVFARLRARRADRVPS